MAGDERMKVGSGEIALALALDGGFEDRDGWLGFAVTTRADEVCLKVALVDGRARVDDDAGGEGWFVVGVCGGFNGTLDVAAGAEDICWGAVDDDCCTAFGQSACTPLPAKNSPIRVLGEVEMPAQAALMRLVSDSRPSTQV